MTRTSASPILALAGGVGGAKLADGLACLTGERLTVLGNTGDDFEHLGFAISPDLDTLMYTLAGVADPVQGWGLAGETWNFMAQVERLGGPAWFRLGDRDLATHALRTQRLHAGETLTRVTGDLCRAFGITARVLPMTDERVRTRIETADELLPFQDYFVRLRCAVTARRILFEGAAEARPNPALARMRGVDAPGAIIICPSNPYLSIDPILAIPGMRDLLRSMGAPVVAVSPIVAGAAIKGPAAKLMGELGHAVSAASVAAHYRGLADALVIDRADAGLAGEIEQTGMRAIVADTVMRSRDDRIALAATCLEAAARL